MTNLKNTVAAIGLMAVLGMGATTTKAGILMSDRATAAPTTQQQQCNGANSANWTSTIRGLLIAAAHGLMTPSGFILTDRATTYNSGCQQDNTVTINGILMSD